MMARKQIKPARISSFCRAFSLVELLIIIGILAILAAILLPVFFVGREKARTVACSANLRQIGNALQSYLLDYDSVYPPDTQVVYTNGKATVKSPSDVKHWCDLLAAYTGGTFWFSCPDRVMPSSWAKEFAGKPKGSGYAFNANLSQAVYPSPNQKASVGKTENVIKNPASLVAVFDSRLFLISSTDPDTSADPTKKEFGPPGATRHQGGANYLFADGHVKLLQQSDLSTSETGDGIHPGFGL